MLDKKFKKADGIHMHQRLKQVAQRARMLT